MNRNGGPYDINAGTSYDRLHDVFVFGDCLCADVLGQKMKLFTPDKLYTSYEAEKILAEYLDKNAVKVYGYRDDIYNYLRMHQYGDPENGPAPHDTHTALLIDIQPIEKEKCEHEPVISNFGYKRNSNGDVLCRCGAKLKPDWKEIK